MTTTPHLNGRLGQHHLLKLGCVSWPGGGAVELSSVRMVTVGRKRPGIVGHFRSRQRE